MQHLLEATEVLIASWILAGGDDRIPTSHGVLDRALEIAVAHQACPSAIRGQLHFVDSRIGLRCVELPALLDWAQRAQLTTTANPSYDSTQVQISPKAAQQILHSLGVAEQDAVQWGTHLRQTVTDVGRSMTAYADPAIEEY